jgi:hypothetical protein
MRATVSRADNLLCFLSYFVLYAPRMVWDQTVVSLRMFAAVSFPSIRRLILWLKGCVFDTVTSPRFNIIPFLNSLRWIPGLSTIS